MPSRPILQRIRRFMHLLWCKRFLDVAQSLGKFPNVGPIVPEIGGQEFRERFVYSYRVIYQVSDEQVLIAAVVHGKRLLTPTLIGLE